MSQTPATPRPTQATDTKMPAIKRPSLSSYHSAFFHIGRAARTISVNDLLCLVGLALYLALALAHPYGAWDAQVRWNPYARVLAYDGLGGLYRAPELAFAHLDYPPLLLFVLAAGFRAFGHTVLVPIAVHGLALAAGLRLVRQLPTWAFVFAALPMVYFAAFQYADLPLAGALLAASVAYRHERPLMVAAALIVALWLKNEGALIAVVLLSLWCLRVRGVVWYAVLPVGAALLLLMAFKAWVAVPNDVMQAGGLLDRLTQPDRYNTVLSLAAHGLLIFGGGVIFLLCVSAFLARVRVWCDVPLWTCALVLVGYLLIYVVTPHDITWHIQTSYDRLLLHLYPTLVYCLSIQRRQ